MSTGPVVVPILFKGLDLLERFVVSIHKPVMCLFGDDPAGSSTQSAGVGGTGPSEVPNAGACRVDGRGAKSAACLELRSAVPLALCERGALGGGPGGGPGKGIPGSQLANREGDTLPVRLAVADEQSLELIAPAEIALREDGGLTVDPCDGGSAIRESGGGGGGGGARSAGIALVELGNSDSVVRVC